MSRRNLNQEEDAPSFTPSLDMNNEDPLSLSPFSAFHKFPSTNVYNPVHLLVIFFFNQCGIDFDGKGLILQLEEFAK